MSTGNNRAVVVTGTSSGIGEATALELDRLGFRVFATVRKDKDADVLKARASERLQTVFLDVSDVDSIGELAKLLQQELVETGLYGLVNNAGVADFTPVELIKPEALQRVFDVNFFGMVKVTQACLPFIRQAKGRIVNLSSVGGKTTIPFGFALCASKHAVESFNEGLRIEMMPFGVKSIAVNPSAIATPAAERMLDQIKALIDTFTHEERALYEKRMLQIGASMHASEAAGIQPEGVAKVIAEALTAEQPKARYPVGPNAKKICFLSGILPARLFDRVKLKMVGIDMEP